MSQPLKTAPPPAPETPEPYQPKIDRRTALAWVGVVGAALAVGTGVVVYGPKTGGGRVTRGYGTDPKLNPPEKAPWSRIMTPEQLQAAALLADFILPATAIAPSASALGVPDFIDEWVSAPYPDQVKDRPLILNGLNGLVWRARRQHGVGLTAATPAQRAAIFGALATPKGPDLKFFKRMRSLVAGAYYTTPQGFRDIGYLGNVARQSDPGPSDAVKAHLDRELKKLGL